jgi:hypothetical protein
VWARLPTPKPCRNTNENSAEYVAKCIKSITPAQHIRIDCGKIQPRREQTGYGEEIEQINSEAWEAFALLRCFRIIQEQVPYEPIIIGCDATHLRVCTSTINEMLPTAIGVDKKVRALYEQIHVFKEGTRETHRSEHTKNHDVTHQGTRNRSS